MKKALWWSLILAIGAGSILMALFVIYGIGVPIALPLALSERQNPGPFDQRKMEAIVERARLMHVPPSEEKGFQVRDLADPNSLYRNGHVLVWASKAGKLTVLIETNDMDHAGSYGFAYSEKSPPSLNEFDGWLPEAQINAHWWKVANHLD